MCVCVGAFFNRIEFRQHTNCAFYYADDLYVGEEFARLSIFSYIIITSCRTINVCCQI